MQRAAITPAQIALVEKSFDSFYPASYDAVAASFYEELFQRDPLVRALFPQDLQDQRRKLMMAFNMAVHGLRHPSSLRPALQRLGQIHTQLGIVPQQYTVVGEALLAAIQQCAGAGLTPEELAAWQAAYAAIVEMMLSTERAE
jgi:hemoglobin-like flavoprotein